MDNIDELLTKGVASIYPSKETLKRVLRNGKKLKLYQGFDPTGKQLHIGHMVGLRKLRQWQDLGHHVIFLIGDGTGQAGDPSGKTTARDHFFTREELRANAREYVNQAGKIVRFSGENKAEILFNGDWLNKLTLPEVLNIAGHFTLAQLTERDLYQERMRAGQDVNLREFLYPLLQAYDSVAMDVDLEIGGTDQTFNMLAGRHLMKRMRAKEKFVMTTPLLTDTRGVKIGKTEGNVIGITDDPRDLFTKIMALPDDVIVRGLEYLTDVPMEQVRAIEQSIAKGENPLTHKKHLAREVVIQCANRTQSMLAQEYFERVVQKGELPERRTPLSVPKNASNIIDVLLDNSLVTSKSQGRRLVEQGGILVNGVTITSPHFEVPRERGTVIQVGKYRVGEVNKL